MHWRWLLSQLLTAPTRRPGQSHVLIPASRTERLVIVHCSSLSRVFSEPMTSFECIKPTKETFERLTAPLASREGCARGGGRRRTPDPQRRDGVIALHCSSSPEPHRPPARAGSFDAASRQLGCAAAYCPNCRFVSFGGELIRTFASVHPYHCTCRFRKLHPLDSRSRANQNMIDG